MGESPDLSRASWFKSSFSNGQGGDCVEHAKLPDGSRAVRHSKHPEEASLVSDLRQCVSRRPSGLRFP
jgi:hypothetical protein